MKFANNLNPSLPPTKSGNGLLPGGQMHSGASLVVRAASSAAGCRSGARSLATLFFRWSTASLLSLSDKIFMLMPMSPTGLISSEATLSSSDDSLDLRSDSRKLLYTVKETLTIHTTHITRFIPELVFIQDFDLGLSSKCGLFVFL